jgi:hypothetical protein
LQKKNFTILKMNYQIYIEMKIKYVYKLSKKEQNRKKRTLEAPGLFERGRFTLKKSTGEIEN